MDRSTEVMHELMQVLRDAERFYLDASIKARIAENRSVFREMAAVQRALIDDLAQQVNERSQQPQRLFGALLGSGTLLGSSRKIYADVLAGMSQNPDAVYVSQLEQVENRLLERYQSSLDGASSDGVREIFERHLIAVRAAHERMQELKLAA
jgi:uncharacterized protein (TIGR02284 family)